MAKTRLLVLLFLIFTFLGFTSVTQAQAPTPTPTSGVAQVDSVGQFIAYILTPIGGIVGIVGGIVTVIANFRWSSKYAEAKDAEIKAMQAHLSAKDSLIAVKQGEIDMLKELTPMKLREYFVSTKESLEEFNNQLSQSLDKTTADLESTKARLELILPEHESNKQKVEQLQVERLALTNKVENLESQKKEQEIALTKIAQLQVALSGKDLKGNDYIRHQLFFSSGVRTLKPWRTIDDISDLERAIQMMDASQVVKVMKLMTGPFQSPEEVTPKINDTPPTKDIAPSSDNTNPPSPKDPTPPTTR